ncbi:ATP-dependent zinc metalloprotease FtsH [Eubacteriales bacterium OttesenSCG-928-K08]|nr:ATP-dependent zinc metalloprotease FtsH [Eubacteriales bacterium OttesenSCG-928-K08]
MNNNNNKNDNRDASQKRRIVRLPRMLPMLLILFLIGSMITSGTFQVTRAVDYSQFLDLLDSGSIAAVEVGASEIGFTLLESADATAINNILSTDGKTITPDAKTVYITGRMDDPGLVDRLRESGIKFTQVVPKNNTLLSIILSLLPFILMIAIYYAFFRMMAKRSGGGDGGILGGIGNVGKSKAKMYSVEEKTGVTFLDVAGQDEAKESLAEMVDYLHQPGKYAKIGAKQPRGALLVGPPGTGKTLLAKAVAGEAGVPFFHLSGSEFVEMFVGVGASRVRDLFQTAAKSAPCIIFIDEIDAIGKKRDTQFGTNDEREQTLNQLLSEMDGFGSNTGILVLAATNRPEVLDPALLRPGRFDRRVIVDRPDLPGRESILKVHAAKVAMEPDVDFHAVALASSGTTGADLANMVNEAALRAVKMGRSTVSQEDLIESVELVIAGKEKKDRVLNEKEKRMVAYHEVGHALVSAKQKHAQPVQKITIIPRTMGSLGYTMSVPEEDRYLLTRGELLGQITMLLGGRAAEQIVFGDVSTGAANDIERATSLARKMVTQYGMSDAFGSMGLESAQNQYLDGRNVSTCSEQTGAQIDNEVRLIIESCQNEAVALLEQNRDALNRISEYLIEKENLTGEQFMSLLEQDAA